MDIGDKKEIFKLGLDINTYYSLPTLNTPFLGGSGTFLPSFSNLFSASSPTTSSFSSNLGFMPNFFNFITMPFINTFHSTSKFFGAIGTKFKSVNLSAKSKELISGIAKRLGFSSSALEKVIRSESGGNAQAVNGRSGATGLIQFMPSTARMLGTTTESIRNMSAEKQLEAGGVVEKYLTKAKSMAGFKSGETVNEAQVYGLVFMPAKAKSKDGVLASSGSLASNWNRGLADSTGQITLETLRRRMG